MTDTPKGSETSKADVLDGILRTFREGVEINMATKKDVDPFYESMVELKSQIEKHYILRSEVEDLEKRAMVREAKHRVNDAIERLYRLDRKYCVEWFTENAEYYKPAKLNLNKES